MIEGRYSISEIDKMRVLLRKLSYYPSGQYRVTRDCDIEDQLRTLMLNGTTWQDIERELQSRVAARDGRALEWHARRDFMGRSG